MRRLSSTLLLICFTLSANSLSAEERLEIIKRSKAATALIDLGEYGGGSSFCIHKSGLFLTNFHVARFVSLGEEITLVLDSSLKSERKVRARFVSYDEENDLALLKSVEELDLTPLKLGKVEELVETQNVTSLGYPFGKRLSTDTEEYPSISINIGRISALRRQSGELRVIQFDAAINPRNSGGPILNDAGDVIGVTVATIPGSQVSFAIPANIVKKFIRKPVILPDRITQLKFSDLSKPVQFDVELLEIPGAIKPDRLEFQFRYAGQQTDFINAQKLSDGFRVSAQPLQLPKDEKLFRVILTREDKQTSLDLPDGKLMVGKREVMLSNLRRLDRREDRFIVTFNDDTKIIAPVRSWDQIQNRENEIPKLEDVERIDVLCHRNFTGGFGYQFDLYAGKEQVLSRQAFIEVEGEPYTLSKAETHGDLYSPPVDRVVIETMIDGKDTLEVRWEGIHWNHHDSQKPGMTDSNGRYTLVNGRKWYPEWEYTTADSKEEDESAVYPLKLGGASWRMKVLKIIDPKTGKHTPDRGKVTLDSQNYYLNIQFEDSAPGAGIYRILLEKKYFGVEAEIKSQRNSEEKAGGN